MFRDSSIREYVEMRSLPSGLTSVLLCDAMRGVSVETADKWAGALSAACRKHDISRSLRRMAAFLGHLALECSGLRSLEENLSYKTPSLINKKFKAIKTDEEAATYVRKPEALANKVYANRNGNGDEASGDGWKYRGRGLIMLTGKANYAAFRKEIGVDVVADPDPWSPDRSTPLFRQHRSGRGRDSTN